MIDPVTWWFSVMQYINNKSMAIASLVETMWLVRYPWPVEIAYERGREFLGHEFKNILIANEYGIKTNPDSTGNPQLNAIIDRIHKVLGNL